jgi:hypothetical protein
MPTSGIHYHRLERSKVFYPYTYNWNFFGNFLAKKINDKKLEISFGWFVFGMGIYIFIRELFVVS